MTDTMYVCIWRFNLPALPEVSSFSIYLSPLEKFSNIPRCVSLRSASKHAFKPNQPKTHINTIHVPTPWQSFIPQYYLFSIPNKSTSYMIWKEHLSCLDWSQGRRIAEEKSHTIFHLQNLSALWKILTNYDWSPNLCFAMHERFETKWYSSGVFTMG